MDVRRAGDALAQPTRAQLFALLSQLRRPAATDELAQRLDLHPNGIRLHLERLEADGLVLRERERQARGRPRDTWSSSPGATHPRRTPISGAGSYARSRPAAHACATSRRPGGRSGASWRHQATPAQRTPRSTASWSPWASSPRAASTARTLSPTASTTA